MLGGIQMPEARNCRRCGKLYNYIGGQPICPDCKDKDEVDFKRVKEYLYQNPGATMSEVSTVLEVSVDKIKKYLKDGKLEIMGDDGNFILECESCGKSIRTGRHCDGCSRDLERNLKSTARQMDQHLSKSEAERKGIGLRYLCKDEKK
jgi:flagellar operon protein (TIGR03826 family)